MKMLVICLPIINNYLNIMLGMENYKYKFDDYITAIERQTMFKVIYNASQENEQGKIAIANPMWGEE